MSIRMEFFKTFTSKISFSDPIQVVRGSDLNPQGFGTAGQEHSEFALARRVNRLGLGYLQAE
jgi:hypothetical protein